MDELHQVLGCSADATHEEEEVRELDDVVEEVLEVVDVEEDEDENDTDEGEELVEVPAAETVTRAEGLPNRAISPCIIFRPRSKLPAAKKKTK